MSKKSKENRREALLPKAWFSTFAIPNRACGEIGRHATLRGWCPFGCGSSNLLMRTKKGDFRVAFFVFKSPKPIFLLIEGASPFFVGVHISSRECLYKCDDGIDFSSREVESLHISAWSQTRI